MNSSSPTKQQYEYRPKEEQQKPEDTAKEPENEQQDAQTAADQK